MLNALHERAVVGNVIEPGPTAPCAGTTVFGFRASSVSNACQRHHARDGRCRQERVVHDHVAGEEDVVAFDEERRVAARMRWARR